MNSRIIDARLTEIYETRFSSTLKGAVVHDAYRASNLLLDARSLSDIELMFESLAELADGRFCVSVSGRWYILFGWDQAVGAIDLQLKRLE